MENIYSSGIAFVFEGDTEKIFYYTMLSYFVSKHPGYSLDIDDDHPNYNSATKIIPDILRFVFNNDYLTN